MVGAGGKGLRRCHINGSHVKKGVVMVSTTLDFAEKYRNLDCIATLHPHVYS